LVLSYLLSGELGIASAFSRLDADELSVFVRQFLDDILDEFGHQGAKDLVRQSQVEAPWCNTDSHEEISIEDLKEFFATFQCPAVERRIQNRKEEAMRLLDEHTRAHPEWYTSTPPQLPPVKGFRERE